MKKMLAVAALMLVISTATRACCIEEPCPDGTHIFCCTLTGSCITGQNCNPGGGEVCCAEYDQCAGEVDVFCDSCVFGA